MNVTCMVYSSLGHFPAVVRRHYKRSSRSTSPAELESATRWPPGSTSTSTLKRSGDSTKRLSYEDHVRLLSDRPDHDIGVVVQACVVTGQVDNDSRVVRLLEERRDLMPVPGHPSSARDQDNESPRCLPVGIVFTIELLLQLPAPEMFPFIAISTSPLGALDAVDH